MNTKFRWRKTLCVGILATVMVVSTGCKSKKPTPLTPPMDSGLTSGSDSVEETTVTGQPEVDLANLSIDELFNDPSNPMYLWPVKFDFDSHALRPDALGILKDNADKIKKTPGAIVLIEGHCDERGTQEYNVTLGDRRALAVREYLIKLGVSGDRLITVSYGEEDPVDPGHNEAAWSKNRRCEFSRGKTS
jgi:peptidoglycan-associated lipoprotein